MAAGVEEMLDMLYDMIDEAKNAPLQRDCCVISRDKALDLLDDIRAQYPMELNEAKRLMTRRNEYLESAKQEADRILQQAEGRAAQLLDNHELLAQAKGRANDMMRQAEERSRELRHAATEYCEDALKRTEEAIADAYQEIKQSHAAFRQMASPQKGQSAGRNVPFDAATDE